MTDDSGQRTEGEMPDSFADYPKSVNERRADNAAMWTPREALISVLRDIDRGMIDPDALIVCFRSKVADGRTDTYFRCAGPDVHTSVGLLAYVQIKIVTSGESP